MCSTNTTGWGTIAMAMGWKGEKKEEKEKRNTGETYICEFVRRQNSADQMHINIIVYVNIHIII